ncbi:8-oxo-dGDP phosphatase NUDT18-like [Littorina saxatilis]|uniref:Nudix hydrolase domain-containing protein n=1 Tax=Littorina saxatilis TaxID=31220 RepID=A0AAN9AI44_9CAEN
MAEEQQDHVTKDLGKLLAGQPVPVNAIDFKRKDALQFVPRTKVNTGYIVMTILFNKNGQVLLVQEAKESCHGMWYLPAGRLERNETLVEGAKREVKEEAGLDCDIVTLLHVHFGCARWMRLSFFGVVTGGQLKTLAEADEESLQAEFYDVSAILNGEVELRAGDIIPPIQQALEYKNSLESTPLHPPLLPTLTPHPLLLHRFVLVADLADNGGLRMLASNKERPHIITTVISPHDTSLNITLHSVLREGISGDKFNLTLHGILGVEHDGLSGQHDGICITTLASLSLPPNRGLPSLRDMSYRWVALTDQASVNALRHAMNCHTVTLIQKA